MADHFRNMGNQVHADTIQQLEVALLEPLAADIVDILTASLPKPVTVTSAQPHPHTFTVTSPAPPPVSFPLGGVSELSSASISGIFQV